MQTRFICQAAIISGLLLCGGASAAVVNTFTDDLAFASSLNSGFGTESFESLADGDLGVASWNSSSGAYQLGFSTDGADALWTGIDANGSRFLSTSSNNMPLTINLSSSTATALGGYVFLTDYDGNRIAGSLTFTLGNGQLFNYNTTAADSNYLGVLSSNAEPITSLTVSTGTEFAWITVDKVVVGQAIPEPSTYAAILGLLLFGLAIWKRRRNR